MYDGLLHIVLSMLYSFTQIQHAPSIQALKVSMFIIIILSYLLISPHQPIPSSVGHTIDVQVRTTVLPLCT